MEHKAGLSSRSLLCQLFAQDWLIFLWGWFNNIEVIQLSILQVTSYGTIAYLEGSCAGLLSTVVWSSQIYRQEQSDGIE